MCARWYRTRSSTCVMRRRTTSPACSSIPPTRGAWCTSRWRRAWRRPPRAYELRVTSWCSGLLPPARCAGTDVRGGVESRVGGQARAVRPQPRGRRSVDVTLAERGRLLDMGTGFDDFSPRALAYATDGVSELAQANRAGYARRWLTAGWRRTPGNGGISTAPAPGCNGRSSTSPSTEVAHPSSGRRWLVISVSASCMAAWTRSPKASASSPGSAVVTASTRSAVWWAAAGRAPCRRLRC